MKIRKSSELRKIAEDFINSRRNANNLVEIIGELQNDENAHAAVLAVELVFLDLLPKGEVSSGEQGADDAETKYRVWLQECYENASSNLISLLRKGDFPAQEQALVTLMKLLLEEMKLPENSLQPVEKLHAILSSILSAEKNTSRLISRFQEFAVSQGQLAEHLWKTLSIIAQKTKKPSHSFIANFFQLLNVLPVTKQDLITENDVTVVWKKKLVQKYVNVIWYTVTKWLHSPQTHKQMLLLLLQKLLPQIQKPLLLTDYLMSCLDSGGAISLLALQGVFILIQNHNLEYPNIYNKLYNMFTEDIFYTNYKIRFYNLSDMFLRSIHLPVNLVAAFIKRLSRLALVAPPPDVHVLLSLIGNLLIRHPTLTHMMNHPVGIEVNGDPFNNEERNPCDSNAISSSLWEIKTLQKHVLPNIASAAGFIDRDLPSTEWDLGAREDSLDEMFDKSVKQRRYKEQTLTFERPTSLALPRNEKLTSYWKLS